MNIASYRWNRCVNDGVTGNGTATGKGIIVNTGNVDLTTGTQPTKFNVGTIGG